jgi:hypothetical protein
MLKKNIKCNIWRVAVRPSYIQDARFLKVKALVGMDFHLLYWSVTGISGIGLFNLFNKHIVRAEGIKLRTMMKHDGKKNLRTIYWKQYARLGCNMPQLKCADVPNFNIASSFPCLFISPKSYYNSNTRKFNTACDWNLSWDKELV